MPRGSILADVSGIGGGRRGAGWAYPQSVDREPADSIATAARPIQSQLLMRTPFAAYEHGLFRRSSVVSKTLHCRKDQPNQHLFSDIHTPNDNRPVIDPD